MQSLMQSLNAICISGKDVLPLIEGGKGIGASDGLSAGSWAFEGGVGTFSGVNCLVLNEQGQRIPNVYKERTREKRQHELIQQAIQGGIQQAQIAYEKSAGSGRIHMNVLWEMGGVEQVLEGILEGTKGLIHGVTCGAGMPYKLASIAERFQVFYIPIVSSARAFKALWQRTYHKVSSWLGSVVYEDPWRAGGHNGLSNQEDPLSPQDPYPRVLALRQVMRSFGLDDVPIIMAGGVWFLREWDHWINNKELGPIGFQFGTRPLLTQESPIPIAWKQRLLTLKPGDISLNKFSPTGFYSSAVRNPFLMNLEERFARQVSFSSTADDLYTTSIPYGKRDRIIYVRPEDYEKCQKWQQEGFTTLLKTPANTVVFVTPQEAETIHKDQAECMGCLSACAFSNWEQKEGSTGLRPDPRSFCIQKTLQDILLTGDAEDNLMFAGHNAYLFGQDPFYANGHIPSVHELIQRIQQGD